MTARDVEQHESSPSPPSKEMGHPSDSAGDDATSETSGGARSLAPWVLIDWLALLGVVVFALVIRLVYVYQLQASPFFAHPAIDAELHVDWATAIAEGRTFIEGVYPRAPLYPWLLGLLYSVTGVGFILPRILVCVLGAVSCGLLFAIAHRFFGRSVAICAGLAGATYWVSIFFEGELLVEPLSVFLNLLALWVLVRKERPGHVAWVVAGLCLGLSALNRPNVLLVVPVLACWPMILHGVGHWKRWSMPVLLFGGSCLLAILPVTIRNYVKGGEAVLIASNGGLNFFIGNNPQSDGMSAILPGVRPDWWGALQDSTAIAQSTMGRELSAGEVSKFYYRAGLRFMRDQPQLAFRLFLHKLRFFWNDVEVPNPYNLYFFTDKYTPIVRFLPLSFGMLVPLAGIGVVLAGKQKLIAQFPLWGFGLAYMIGVVAFFVTSRFRLPIVPIVILYAAYGFVEMLRLLGERKWFPVGAGVLAVFLSWPLLHTEDIEGLKDHAVSYCKVARALCDQQKFDEAEAACRKAIENKPELALAHEILGELELARGNLSAGIKSLRKALELDSSRPVYRMLSGALIHQHRFEEAARVLEDGTEALPGYVDLKLQLARLLSTCSDRKVRDGREALAIVDTLLKQLQPDAVLLDARGMALAELGRFDEAVDSAKQAMALIGMDAEDLAVRRGISDRLKQYQARQPYREE